jgi:hypothetical protein
LLEEPSTSLVVVDGEPLIGIVLEEGGREVVRYFISEEEADRLVHVSLGGAFELAGAWRDLDWDHMARQLDRIRHESPPSSPLSL